MMVAAEIPEAQSARADAHARWEVFGRKSPAEHLYHVGSVPAPNPELAAARALVTFDEYKWIELRVFPRAAAINVICDPSAPDQIGAA